MTDPDVLRRLESVAATLVAAKGQAFAIDFHGLARDIRAMTASRTQGVYLHLFHGRNTPDEDMEDWGFDGPVIGPLNYVHTTYGAELKYQCDWEVAREFFPEEVQREEQCAERYDNWSLMTYPCEGQIPIREGLVLYGGKYYGDWSIFGPELVGPDGRAL